MFLTFQVLPFLLLPLHWIFQIPIHRLTLKHSKNMAKMHWHWY